MSLLKKKKSEEKMEEAKMELDFLVHNMPIAEEPAATKAPSRPSQGKTSYKKVGAVIISVGTILILGLAYLGYRLVFDGQEEPLVPGQQITGIPNGQEGGPSDIGTASSDPVTSQPVATSSIDIASSSENVEVEISTSTPDITSIATSSEEVSGILEDSDADGLDDLTESAFGTSQYLSDSDGDSYLDLSEIKNGYNPSGSGKIGEAGFLGYYHNQAYRYRLVYPKAWGQKNIGGDYFSLFSIPDGSLVQISVQDNGRSQDIISWYRQEFSFFDTFDQNRLIQTDDGNQGIFSADGLTVYLTDQDYKYIYIASFVPVSEGQIDYFQAFRLMVESLRLDYEEQVDLSL